MDREAILLDTITSLCDASSKQFNSIIDTSERLAYASTIIDEAQKGKEKLLSVKRHFHEIAGEEDDDSDQSNGKPGPSTICSDEASRYKSTLTLVEKYKETRRDINWMTCHGRIKIKLNFFYLIRERGYVVCYFLTSKPAGSSQRSGYLVTYSTVVYHVFYCF